MRQQETVNEIPKYTNLPAVIFQKAKLNQNTNINMKNV